MKDIRESQKLIGTIDFSTEELLYEDCIGRVNFPNNIGECSIYVYSDEGTIPHFHIIPKNGSSECCVCIYEPLYFNHGNKQLQLNSKQRKILNKWLKSEFKYNKKVTNWEVISTAWIIGNGDKYAPNLPSQPNYTNLVNMRDS